MSHLITYPIEAPPPTTEIFVAYYDETERAQFSTRLGRDLLGDSGRRVAVATTDLCTYFLYYKLRSGLAGFENHGDIATRWMGALFEFDGLLEFADGSLRLLRQAGTSTGTTERIGEAIGLSVASNLHGLHQGDWTRIPATNTRQTLDYWRPLTASDGERFVQVECKGSAVEDNRLKSTTVSNHKTSIKRKKAMTTAEERASSILYGTIGVLDDRPDSVARCWLVDPPTGVVDDPFRFKIISRLSFIAECISFLGARSTLAASLQTRLADLRAISNIGPLDGVPLRSGSGKPYAGGSALWMGEYNSWFASKSTVNGGPAGGHVFALDSERFLFVGIQDQLVSLAERQRFSEIYSYNFVSGTVLKTVTCLVSRGRFQSEFRYHDDLDKGSGSSENGYVRFVLVGNLHYCQSGLVWGILSRPARFDE